MHSETHHTQPSIPVFIQQGVAVLGNTAKEQLLQSSLSSHSPLVGDILQRYGHDHESMWEIITPELLRRVKLGQCEEQDLQQVIS